MRINWLGALLLSALAAFDQAMAQELNLWDGPAPHAKPHENREYSAACGSVNCVHEVSVPTLTLYPPSQPSGAAVVILPGGNYQGLAIDHEGHDVARYLASQGILGAVLKYRLPNPDTSEQPENAPLDDVRRALALLHQQADQRHLNRNKIGVMGFSAGSHLATLSSVWRSPEPSENPDFSLLIYGVSRPTPDNTQWLAERLYYRPLTPDEARRNNLLAGLSAQTPPAFLVHALDDDICPYQESTAYAEALHAVGVEVELHVFAKGGHGFGLGRGSDGTAQWPALAVAWLKRLPH